MSERRNYRSYARSGGRNDWRGASRTGSGSAYGRNGSAYLYGSAAPDYSREPWEENAPSVRRERSPQRAPYREPYREPAPVQRPARTISPAAVFGIAVVSILLMLSLIFYVNMFSGVTATARSIASLETEIKDLRTQNDQTEQEINSSVNLEDIRYRAIHDLGMQYADSDQIVGYTSGAGDYVHQVNETGN